MSTSHIFKRIKMADKDLSQISFNGSIIYFSLTLIDQKKNIFYKPVRTLSGRKCAKFNFLN